MSCCLHWMFATHIFTYIRITQFLATKKNLHATELPASDHPSLSTWQNQNFPLIRFKRFKYSHQPNVLRTTGIAHAHIHLNTHASTYSHSYRKSVIHVCGGHFEASFIVASEVVLWVPSSCLARKIECSSDQRQPTVQFKVKEEENKRKKRVK